MVLGRDLEELYLLEVLFAVYIDELLQLLQNFGVGCHWKGGGKFSLLC